MDPTIGAVFHDAFVGQGDQVVPLDQECSWTHLSINPDDDTMNDKLDGRLKHAHVCKCQYEECELGGFVPCGCRLLSLANWHPSIDTPLLVTFYMTSLALFH